PRTQSRNARASARIASAPATRASLRSSRRTVSSVSPAHSSSTSLVENPCPRSALVHSRASSWTSRSRSVASRRARFTSSGSLGAIPLLLHYAPHGRHQISLPAGRRHALLAAIRSQLAQLAQSKGTPLAV